MFEKIDNPFWFINDLLSLNDDNYDSTFEEHLKGIYTTKVELKEENNSNSCAFFLDIYMYIEIENSILNYVTL